MKKYFKILIIIVLLIVIILSMYLLNTRLEGLSVQYEIENTKFDLKDYENIPITDRVYENIEDLINNNDEIKTASNIIINIVNGESGIGSQITLFMQNSYHLKEINPNIICLPHFSNNNHFFKYHDKNYNNSFFIYYKRKTHITNLVDYKIYFAKASISNIPFFTSDVDTMKHEPNNKYITAFNSEYEYIKNNSVIKSISNIKKPLIGIHLRSTAQKMVHESEFLSTSYSDRLSKMKEKLDNELKEYSVFVMTDTNDHLELAKSIFGDIYYFDNVMRIDGQSDIIPELSYEEVGYKLGLDILNECFALSLCDKVYLTKSNINVIITTMNPNIEREEL
jgi:hypothetical protein